MSLCAHTEIMRWRVKGLGQMNWQDRGAPAINSVFKESISQYLWDLGDACLLFKEQSMLLASAHSVKKDLSVSIGLRITAYSLHIFCCFPPHFP